MDNVYLADCVLDGVPDPDVVARLAGPKVESSERTRQRVVHRRADVERERRVELVETELVGPRLLRIQVRCAHGTYVKEWISGDGGRTVPSLADAIGVGCHCASLDVLDILTGAAGAAFGDGIVPAGEGDRVPPPAEASAALEQAARAPAPPDRADG